MSTSSLRERFNLSPGCSGSGAGLSIVRRHRLHVAGVVLTVACSPVASAGEPDSVGAHAFCGTSLIVTQLGQFRTPYEQPPGADFAFRAGLWVGAVADRGAGPVASVSTGLYPYEYAPPGGGRDRPVRSAGAVRTTYTDVEDPVWIPSTHEPLGLRVEQKSVVRGSANLEGRVSASFRIHNISHEYSPPGWNLENVYVGIMMDPDVGREDGGYSPWGDDHAGFVRKSRSPGSTWPSGTKFGDLAYAWDESSGSGEDTDTQLGIVVRRRETHRFAVWSSALDPPNDETRYELLRGASHDTPTIDPFTTRANDQRMLVAVGPIEALAPGESVGFCFDFVCGALVPNRTWPVVRNEGANSVTQTGTELGRVWVGPNPVYLGAGASRATVFSNLPSRATVRVYSMDGRLVTAIDPLGARAVSWNLRSVSGERVPGGVYVYRVSSPDEGARTGKLVILR